MKLAAAIMLAVTALGALPAPAIAQAVYQGYELGPEDGVEITIYGPTSTVIKTRIKSNGEITLPFIGNVVAGGQTPQGLAALVARNLKGGGFFTNPIVNVEVTAYASKSVTILGEVGTPGIFPLDHPQTLGEMIARVGGLRNGGSDRVSVRHVGSNKVDVYSVGDIARSADRDIQLRDGDVLFVGGADRFYIYGQVGSAGMFPILPGMTVRQALARAGGPTLAGSERKIVLYRGGKESDVDLTEIVRADDVLFVRERAF